MKKKESFTHLSKDDLITARTLIINGFWWLESREGYNYWEKVVNALERIIQAKCQEVN